MLKWFKFPVFEDPNKNQTARALLAITLMIIALSVVFNIVLVVFLGSTRSFVAVAGVTVVTLVVHLMARRGYVRHGAIILCTLTWMILTIVALPPEGRGVYDMAFSAYITPILMASLLVGGTIGIVFAGLSAVSGIFLLLLMAADSSLSIYDAGVYWAANSLGFIFTATLLWLFERRFQRARERTQRRETQLEQSSRQLEYEIIERARFQEAYRTVVENSLQGLGIFQNDRIVFANATMSNMFGYSLNELLAVENVNKLLAIPEDSDSVTFHRKDRLAGKPVPSRYEVEGRHRSGESRWFEVIPTRIMYKGQPAIQYAFVDITERKKAEDALWAREEDMRMFQDRLKALHEVSIELSTISAFDELCRRAVELGRERLGFDRLGVLLFDEQNQKIRGTFGTNAKGELSDDRELARDLTPDSWVFDALKRRESVHYQDDAALFDDGVVVGRGWNALAVLWSGDQNLGWLAADSLILKNPLTPNQLELLRLYAMTLGNLLAQRRTEEASKRSQEWFAKIFQLSPLSISMSMMPDGRYVDVNPRWCEMFGYSREEAIGHTGPELGLWLDLVERDALTKDVLASGRMPEREVMLKDRSGASYYTMMSAERIESQGEQYFLTMVYDITERKRAEQALKRSEEWFAKIFETAPVAIAISLTSTGVYEDINPAWCELFGYKREEIIGRTGIDLNLWDAEQRAELVRMIDQQGKLDRHELQITRRDGTPLNLVMSSQLIELDGTPHFLTMISDITERKKAEAALQESERHAREFQEKLKILHEVSIELSSLDSFDALCRRVVELGREQLGFDRMGLMLFDEQNQQMLGTFGTDVQGQLRDERAWVRQLASDSWAFEVMRRKDAVDFRADVELYDEFEVVGRGWNALSVLWSGDKSIGWLTADNLTQQKPLAPNQLELLRLYSLTIGNLLSRLRSEEARKRSQELFAKIFQSSPVSISISSTPDGRYVDVNPRWSELFGYSREEALSHTGTELGLWVEPSARDKVLETTVAAGELRQHEAVFKHRDGGLHHAMMSMDILELHGEKLFLTMVHDITERKQAEEALRKSEGHAREFQDKLKILQQVSLELTAVESLEAMARKAIELGHSALGYDRIGFLLFENDEKSKVWRFGIESDGLIHTEQNSNYNYKEDDITTNLALNREYIFVNEDAELRDFDKPVGRGWNVVTGVWGGNTSLGWLAADNLFTRQPLAPYQIELLKLYGLTLGHLVTRKRTEEALKRSQEWFAKIFQTSPVSISISSLPNAQYVDVNPRWSELFGYTRDEAIGNTGTELGLWVKPAQSDEIAEATLTEGRLLQQEVMLKHRDGTIHHAMMSTDIIELHGNKLFLSMVNDITERKRTEEALKRSEEWFAKIFQSSPVSISISTVPEGRYVDVNPTWSEFFGYSREEAVGHTGFELGLWADIPHRDDFIGIVSAHGKMRQHESMVKQRDGTLHSVIMSAELISLNGRLHFLTMVNDITERKKAEEALRKSEEHAREFQDKLKVLQQVSLELTNMESFDDLCRRAIELGRDALGFDRIGLLLFDEMTHSMVGTFGIDEKGKLRDERNMSYNIEADEVMYSLLTNRESIYFSEDTELHNFGTFIGRGWNVATGMWDGSSSIGWLAADNLISRKPLVPYQIELLKLYGLTLGHLLTRKRTEEALKRSEEWFSTVFRMSPFAIAIRRIATGGYVDVNDSWCALYGYSRDEVLGRTSEDLNVWADPQQRAEVLKTMSAEGKVREAEVNIRRRDGEIRSVLLSTEKVDFNGKPHFVSTLADITERKQVEQHRLELALANERLELFREFMTNITHDLKTPLSVINTSVELMERIKDADRQKEKIAAIKEQTARLDKYIQDMLTISRLDHAPDLALRPVDFNRLATDARDRLQPTAEKKNVTMQLEFEPQAPYVLADEGELDRMLVNLVENALNYTPEGGSIWIRTRIDQDNVVAEIADTGIGIGEKDLPRIFDRFYRADTARSTKGTGLGLAIVRRIVEMHGGTIDVDSTPGKGTTFSIRLPLVEITEAKDG